MATPVITIARQLGSNGDALGHRVAQQLGIPLLAQEVLELAAQEAGVSLETLESAERVPSWIERVLDAIGESMSLEPFTDRVTASTLERMMTSADYRRILQHVVRGLADRGPCVIVGHAGQLALQYVPHVLNVYVYAPLDIRVQRIAGERNIPHANAAAIVRADDAQRNALFSTYYGVRWDDPELYTLMLNTDVLDMDIATEVVLQVVQHMSVEG